MINSCSDYTKNNDLRLQNEILEDYSSEDEDVVPASQNVKSRRLHLGPLSLLGDLKSFTAPLIFLGTLKCATGSGLHTGWEILKSNLCNLIYARDCFSAAISSGKDDVPSVDVTGTLHSILSKAGIHTSPDNPRIFPLKYMGSEMDIDKVYYVGEYVGAVFRGLVFNRTEPMLRQLTENSMERYCTLRNLDMVDNPYPHDVADYQFNEHAIKSNLSRDAVVHILFSSIRTRPLRYRNYCPAIRKYIMPVYRHTSSSVKNIDVLPESGIKPTSDIDLALVVTMLTFVGILWLTLYAVSSSTKRRRSTVSRESSAGSDLLRRASRIVDMCSSRKGIHYQHLSKTTVKEL
ncbi:hypothetical protein [Candidatus Ichthyocystis hellenicum]|uniref:hypothetical protein n=1 Tax=Candidatus Ichthyocystis hellenicum TaxID=1561003 RepID=UPI000B861178|nr:hypothetical protein [Candidatus Ichthyocystis hellenicum]